MAKIDVRRREDGVIQVMADGVDLTDHIYCEGFGLVMVGGDPQMQEWGLRLTLAIEPEDLKAALAAIGSEQ